MLLLVAPTLSARTRQSALLSVAPPTPSQPSLWPAPQCRLTTPVIQPWKLKCKNRLFEGGDSAHGLQCFSARPFQGLGFFFVCLFAFFCDPPLIAAYAER